MIHTKDFLLLLIVIFITVVVIQPDDSVLNGIDKNYLLTALAIVVTIALTHYSKFVVATMVSILAIGANLPHEIARILNIDARILLGSLVVVLLVAVANRIIKLPTGLDKLQGISAAHRSVARNPDIPELNSKNDRDMGSGFGVEIGQYEVKDDTGQILT
jgi:hypothetical protein